MSALPAIPAWMRQSARVDLAQLLAGVRPVMRSEFSKRPQTGAVRQWARRHGLHVAFDGDGFFALSREAVQVRRTLRMDARPGRHVVALGRLLGYPECCCLAAGRREEEGLDGWAEAVSRRRFVGWFRLIRFDGYRAGRALISHVPCSGGCAASLRMAQRLEGSEQRRSGTSRQTPGQRRRGH